jgi:vacuolar-type H+-ATPase subunit I/STV1
MTEEQRKEVSKQRQLSQEHARQNFKIEYADSEHWKKLARAKQFRMAQWWHPGSNLKYARRALKAIGKDSVFFREITGLTLQQFAAANPTYTAFAIQGLILEMEQETCT